MLERLRAATGGIVAKILLGILVISFAVWGASDAFIAGGPGEVIRVGDTRVSAVDYRLAYLNRMNALERQLGQPLTQDQAKALGIEQSITNQLVAGAVLDQTAREMGLGIAPSGWTRMPMSKTSNRWQSAASSSPVLHRALSLPMRL
jgi:peptidyl-prolyl cis-trans isomerase D